MASLTQLAEDEQLLRRSVREFAEQQIRPLVREMDEHAKIPRSLIDQLFDLGVMGIEIPESLGGSGGRVLSIGAGRRGTVARRPVGRRARRRPEHPRHQRHRPLGQRRSEGTVSAGARLPQCRGLCPVGSSLGQRCVRPAGAGPRGWRRVCARRPQAVDHQRQRGGRLHRLRHGQSRRGLPRHHGVHRRTGTAGIHGRQEGRQARHPRVEHMRAHPRRLPRAERDRCSAKSARATRSRSRR